MELFWFSLSFLLLGLMGGGFLGFTTGKSVQQKAAALVQAARADVTQDH